MGACCCCSSAQFNCSLPTICKSQIAIKESQLGQALHNFPFQLCFQTILTMNTLGIAPMEAEAATARSKCETKCPFHSRRDNSLPAFSHSSFLTRLIRQQRSNASLDTAKVNSATGKPSAMTLATSNGGTSSSADLSRLMSETMPNLELNEGGREKAAEEEPGTALDQQQPRLPTHNRSLLKVKSSSIDQPDQVRAQARRDAAKLLQQEHWSALATNNNFSIPSSSSTTASAAATEGEKLVLPTHPNKVNDTMRTAGQAGYPSFASMFQPPSPKGTVRRSDEDDGYIYLNQYKLSNQTLGHGTYSIVKLAYNTADNSHYAMKILSKKKLMKKHRLTRKTGDPMQEAYREIAILKKLNHPNIIRLVEVLDDPSDDFLYMAFELLERGEVLSVPTADYFVRLVPSYTETPETLKEQAASLGRKLAGSCYVLHGAVGPLGATPENPLSESTVWSYFRDLVLGVEYLHYNGILHRDLKPSNLLLDDNGRLKIADFGLSHMFEGPDAQLGGTVGTPAFHAPELLSGTIVPGNSSPKSHPNSRSGSPVENGRATFSGTAMDIWSMGITLYSLVFGDVPFRDQFIVGLHNQIRSFPPNFPSDIVVSDQLQDVITRLLEKDPAKRISIAELRVHPWLTRAGSHPLLPLVDENCKVQISVTEEDIRTSVRSIPHLDTLILVKAMLKRASFHHPFKNDDARKGSLDSNYPYSKTSMAT